MAAVLTVLGYSIYDTIIIFDRIRENIPLMRRSPFATIANVSLWETISRSLATTFITLLPIICLLILGGAIAQGLRLRADRRRHLGRVLLDLHRRAAAHDLEGARAGVRAAEAIADQAGGEPDGGTPARRGRGAEGRSALDPDTAALAASEAALAAEPTPELVDVGDVADPVEPRRRRAARSGGSAGARGRMAARGSSRLLLDTLEELLAELPARVRGSRERFSESALAALRALVDELNLVTRDELDELELRVAQLEHRLRLLEGPTRPPAGGRRLSAPEARRPSPRGTSRRRRR